MQRFARCAVYVMTKITQINFTPPITLKPEREEDHKSTHKMKQIQTHPAVSDGSDDKILLGVSIPEMTDDFNKVIFLAFEKKIATMDNVEYSNYHDLLGIAGDRRLV